MYAQVNDVNPGKFQANIVHRDTVVEAEFTALDGTMRSLLG